MQPAANRPLRRDPLVVANVVLVLTILLHGADHERQGTGTLTAEVYWGGAVLAVLAFSTLFFTLGRHARAPLVAAVVGLWTAIGVTASHVLPHWSAFSDSYPQIHADALSWAAALAEIFAALVFGLIGLRELRRRGVHRRAETVSA